MKIKLEASGLKCKYHNAACSPNCNDHCDNNCTNDGGDCNTS